MIGLAVDFVSSVGANVRAFDDARPLRQLRFHFAYDFESWPRGGFSAHNDVRVAAEDAEGGKKLAGYMLRAPMSLQKMTYDAATGTVIYRSKMHAGLKRNFQVMPGAAWLAFLCKHISARRNRGRMNSLIGRQPCRICSMRSATSTRGWRAGRTRFAERCVPTLAAATQTG